MKQTLKKKIKKLKELFRALKSCCDIIDEKENNSIPPLIFKWAQLLCKNLPCTKCHLLLCKSGQKTSSMLQNVMVFNVNKNNCNI